MIPVPSQLEFREEKLLLPLLANVSAIIYNYHFEASNLDPYLERRVESWRGGKICSKCELSMATTIQQN